MILSFLGSLWGRLFSSHEGKLVKVIKKIGNENANNKMKSFLESDEYEIIKTAFEEVNDYVTIRMQTDDPRNVVEMAYCQSFCNLPHFLEGIVRDLSIVDVKKKIDDTLNNTTTKEKEWL